MIKLRLKSAAAILIILFLILGCSRDPQTRPQIDNQEKTKIAVSIARTGNDNEKIFKKILQDKAKKVKMEVMWFDAQNDVIKQQEDIEKALKDKAKVIIIDSIDSEMLKNTIKNAQKQGVKVIALRTLPEDTVVEAYITPDYRRSGEMQGQQVLEEAIGEKPLNLLVLRGSEGNQVADSIFQGNMNILQDNRKIGQVWVEEIINWDAVQAYERVKEYLNKEEIPGAILAHSPELTAALLQAVNEAENKSVRTFGMGTEIKSVKALEQGMHSAEVDFMPELMAQIIIETADDLAQDEPWEYEQQILKGRQSVPTRFTPIRSITMDNAYLLNDREKVLQKQGNEKTDNEQEGSNQEGSNQEGNSGNSGEESSGNSGKDEKGSKQGVVVKIKTKDGQEFQMNINGEVESIELKGQEKQDQDKKGGEQNGGE